MSDPGEEKTVPVIMESDEVAQSRALVEARLERLVNVREDVVAIRAGKLVEELYVKHRQALDKRLEDALSGAVGKCNIPKMVKDLLVPLKDWFKDHIEGVPVQIQEQKLTETWSSNEEVLRNWIAEFVDKKAKEMSAIIDGYVKKAQDNINSTIKSLPPDQQSIKAEELQEKLNNEKKDMNARRANLVTKWKELSIWRSTLLTLWQDWRETDWTKELRAIEKGWTDACRNQMKESADQRWQELKLGFLQAAQSGLNDLWLHLIGKTEAFLRDEASKWNTMRDMGEDFTKWSKECLTVAQEQDHWRGDLVKLIAGAEILLEKEIPKQETIFRGDLPGILTAEQLIQKEHLEQKVKLYMADEGSKWMTPSLEVVMSILKSEIDAQFEEEKGKWDNMPNSVCPTNSQASKPQQTPLERLMAKELSSLTNLRNQFVKPHVEKWKNLIKDLMANEREKWQKEDFEGDLKEEASRLQKSLTDADTGDVKDVDKQALGQNLDATAAMGNVTDDEFAQWAEWIRNFAVMCEMGSNAWRDQVRIGEKQIWAQAVKLFLQRGQKESDIEAQIGLFANSLGGIWEKLLKERLAEEQRAWEVGVKNHIKEEQERLNDSCFDTAPDVTDKWIKTFLEAEKKGLNEWMKHFLELDFPEASKIAIDLSKEQKQAVEAAEKVWDERMKLFVDMQQRVWSQAKVTSLMNEEQKKSVVDATTKRLNKNIQKIKDARKKKIENYMQTMVPEWRLELCPFILKKYVDECRVWVEQFVNVWQKILERGMQQLLREHPEKWYANRAMLEEWRKKNTGKNSQPQGEWAVLQSFLQYWLDKVLYPAVDFKKWMEGFQTNMKKSLQDWSSKFLNDDHRELTGKRKTLEGWKKNLQDALGKIMEEGKAAWDKGMTTFLDVQPEKWTEMTAARKCDEQKESSASSPESRFRKLVELCVEQENGKLAEWVETLVGKGPTRMIELVRNGLLPKELLKTSLPDLEVLQDIFDDGSGTLQRPMEVPSVTAMTGSEFLPDVTTRASIATLPVMVNGGLFYQLTVLKEQTTTLFGEIETEVNVLQLRLQRLNEKLKKLRCEVDEPQLILSPELLSEVHKQAPNDESKPPIDESKARMWVVDFLRKRNTRLRCIQKLDELMSRHQQIYGQLASEPEFKDLAMTFSRFVYDTSESDGRMTMTYERKVRFEIAGRWRLETKNGKKEAKSTVSKTKHMRCSADNLKKCFNAVRVLEEKICKKHCMERSKIIDQCLAIVDQLEELPGD